jgi:hypothetical protein
MILTKASLAAKNAAAFYRPSRILSSRFVFVMCCHAVAALGRAQASAVMVQQRSASADRVPSMLISVRLALRQRPVSFAAAFHEQLSTAAASVVDREQARSAAASRRAARQKHVFKPWSCS